MYFAPTSTLRLVLTCITVLDHGVFAAGMPRYEDSPREPLKSVVKRFDKTSAQYLNDASEKYYVDPSGIPDVNFDVGESYSGRMPLNATSKQDMFFWFYPTVNPAGKDDIIVWFNGGPGCSSMEGITQENGPWMWRPGTFAPVPNAYSWHKLANIIWVEYPIGTGFSSGPVTALNNDDAAQDFLLFWKNFMDTFGLHDKKIFLTGESYAGVHVPYVGSAMLAEKNPRIYNVQGALFYNGVLPHTDGLGHDQRVLPAFARYWGNILNLSPSNIKDIEHINQHCGHDKYVEKYLSYPPPKGPFPAFDVSAEPECDVLTPFFAATNLVNPCFNQYHISDTCGILFDILGYPNMPYVPEGAEIWFNNKAVRKALHVPEDAPDWNSCQGPVYAGAGVDNYNNEQHAERTKTLIEATNNVIVGSGLMDMVVAPNVTALALQMLEWNKKQGFRSLPDSDFILPASTDIGIPNLAGGGYQGVWRQERGLTFVTIKLAGHMVPQYAPTASFRNLEVLLGRVKSLGSGDAYSINISTSYEWPF